MIRGMERFKAFFRDYQEHYVLIGGAACDLIFEEAAVDFRATKDLDLVLIVEALTPEFGKKFWEFIYAGGYQNRVKSNGSPQFYRFDKPVDHSYPFMIELFARTESVFDNDSRGCVPLHISDEISSLSAILLNEEYYNMLLAGKTVLSDMVILLPVYLIPFKAKAWLDLSERKANGQAVDERDIRKHKNDIVRLIAILTGNETCILPEKVLQDMQNFIACFESEPVEPKALKIPGLTAADIVQVLKKVYLP